METSIDNKSPKILFFLPKKMQTGFILCWYDFSEKWHNSIIFFHVLYALKHFMRFPIYSTSRIKTIIFI